MLCLNRCLRILYFSHINLQQTGQNIYNSDINATVTPHSKAKSVLMVSEAMFNFIVPCNYKIEHLITNINIIMISTAKVFKHNE